MKALSLLKAKTAGDGEGHPRAPRRRRRRHRRRSPEAEELQGKDVAAASSSAKIAPAQLHEAADGDHRKDRLHQDEERGQGGAKHEHCDKCCSPLDDGDGGGPGDEEAAAGTADAASDGEWAAEPEPGVLMTLVSCGDGRNYLRRIRFSEEYFGDAWAAQTWWADNCDSIVELYSVVVQPEHHSQDGDDDDPAAPVTPCQSEDDEHQRQVHDRSGSF